MIAEKIKELVSMHKSYMNTRKELFKQVEKCETTEDVLKIESAIHYLDVATLNNLFIEIELMNNLIGGNK